MANRSISTGRLPRRPASTEVHSRCCRRPSNGIIALIRRWTTIQCTRGSATCRSSSRSARPGSSVNRAFYSGARKTRLRIARELIRMSDTLTLPYTAREAKPPSKRIPVAVLGATGSVGQRFVQLLEAHPWFKLHEVVASERSAGKSYGEAADWRLDSLMPRDAAALPVKQLGAELDSRVVFSSLDSSVA